MGSQKINSTKYNTLRIRIANADNVRLEIHDSDNRLISDPPGSFGFKGKVRSRILELQAAARNGELSGSKVEELGQLLFSALLDESLKVEFFNHCHRAEKEKALLRLELDVDESRLPEVAALPWEFMYAPPGAGHGALWLATAPGIVFTRRRAAWKVPESIRLKTGERLRIAATAAAPNDGNSVRFQKIFAALQEMAKTGEFDLELLEAPNRNKIDKLLEKKPHIFHFIGHGRLEDEKRQETGQLALVNEFGESDWVSADYFSELFNRHRPGLVVLQACESGALSMSKAFVGIASRVIQMNVPAVAAMQFDVFNTTAQRFALEFYRRLAGGEPVDKAAQEARRHIALGPSGYNSRDFATPVLFMSLREGRLFQWETEPKRADISQNTISIEKFLGNDNVDDLNYGLFGDVVRFIKGIGKKELDPEGKKRMGLLHEFLGKEITIEEFTERWGVEPDVEDREKIPDYETLAALLKRGELIPFLGPGVLPLSGFPVPSSQDLVKKMALQVKYRDFNGTLPMISQYYKSEKKYSRGLIVNELTKLMHKEKEPNSPALLYDLMADIDAPIMVVSTSYDNLLEFAFYRKRKRFAVVSHHIQGSPGSDLGKLQVRFSDKPSPNRLYTAEEISGLKLLDDEYSIIYKLCGNFNLVDDNKWPPQEPIKPDNEPPMIFEEEFFIFSKYLEQSIPDHFIRKFSDFGFLFLGYNLDDWQDRLIAYVISKKWKNSSNSFSVCKEPKPYERTFWKSLLSIELYGVELEEFIKNLHLHMGARADGKRR